MTVEAKNGLACYHVALPVRLAALWTAAMFCYVYADFIALWQPGHIAGMAAGDLGPLGTATPAILSAVAVTMAIPAVMIPLSILLAPAVSRALNVLFGVLYTLIIAATVAIGAPPFYIVFGIIEMALTLTIVWLAWTWPRADAG